MNEPSAIILIKNKDWNIASNCTTTVLTKVEWHHIPRVKRNVEIKSVCSNFMLFFYQTITTTKLTDEHHNLQMNKDKQINEKKRSERCKHCTLPMQVGSVLHLCTKFEADLPIHWKVFTGSRKSEIRSRDPGHAHLGVVLWYPHREAPSMSIPNLKQRALFVQKLLGGLKIRNWVTWPRPRPFRGRFIFHMQAGSVLHHCTKFEAYCSIRSKVIKVVPTLRN